MLSSGEAAFLILEITAILFPLLFIILQFFNRYSNGADEDLVGDLRGFIQYIVFAAIVLLVSVSGASIELLRLRLSLNVVISLIGLHIAFLLLGLTAAIFAVSIWRNMTLENEQVPLIISRHKDEMNGERDEP